MGNNQLIKHDGCLIKRVGNAISVTNKLLALIEKENSGKREIEYKFCTLSNEQLEKYFAYINKYIKTYPDFDFKGLVQSTYDIVYNKQKDESFALTYVSMIPKIIDISAAINDDFSQIIDNNSSIDLNTISKLKRTWNNDIKAVKEYISKNQLYESRNLDDKSIQVV